MSSGTYLPKQVAGGHCLFECKGLFDTVSLGTALLLIGPSRDMLGHL